MRWGAVREHLKKCIAEGRIPDDEPIVLKFPRQDAKRRAVNKPDAEGKRKTRVAWDCGDGDSYAELHKQRERYFQLCGDNPTVGTDLMIIVLKIHPDAELRQFLEGLETARETLG